MDDRPVELDVAYLGAQLSVRIDGQVVDLTIEGSPPEVGAVASGHRSYVRVESERMRAAEQAKKTSAGAERSGRQEPDAGPRGQGARGQRATPSRSARGSSFSRR